MNYCYAYCSDRRMAEKATTLQLLDAPPPDGCKMDNIGGRVRLTVSTRWYAITLATLLFSPWVCIGTIAIWLWILGLTPAWAPQPASPMPLASAIVLYLLVVPFTILAFRALLWTAMSVAGRVEVTFAADQIIVWSGIGSLGRVRRIDFDNPEQIKFKQHSDDGRDSVVALEVHRGGSSTRLVSGVPQDRILWLGAVLKELSSTGSR